MRQLVVVVLTLVLGATLAAGLVAFEPWRLWTSSTVDEPLPTLAPVADDVPVTSGRTPRTPAPSPAAPPSEPPAPELVELASGAFEAAEHATSGTARIIELADGSRFVRLEDLDSSDGPDLHVWVTDQPSGGAWGSYDDGRYLRLGELTATGGNQNYPIPPDADLRGLRSVVIWCDRFDVAFGTAPVSL